MALRNRQVYFLSLETFMELSCHMRNVEGMERQYAVALVSSPNRMPRERLAHTSQMHDPPWTSGRWSLLMTAAPTSISLEPQETS